MLVRERRKHVRDGLLYTFICICIALSVDFVHYVFVNYRDFLYARANKTINYQVSQKIPFINQISVSTISFSQAQYFFAHF
jgi:hypothetical protein